MQGQRQHTVVLTRLNEHGPYDADSSGGDTHHVTVFQAFFLGQGRRDANVIIPGDLGHRVGQFLQPGVVGVTTVGHADLRVKHE